MKRIHFVCPAIVAFLFLLFHTSCNDEPAGKPNIIFLFADDQSYNTLPVHGNREIQTPNIDRLAREGTSFTHAYNMGAWNGAVCIASRAMINTGKFVWRAEQAEKNPGTYVPGHYLYIENR